MPDMLRYSARRIKEAADNFWDVLDNGEPIALTGEEEAHKIVTALNGRDAMTVAMRPAVLDALNRGLLKDKATGEIADDIAAAVLVILDGDQ